MLNMVKKMIQIRKKECIWLTVTALSGFLVGIIVVAIISAVFDMGNEIVEVGTLLALMATGMFVIFGGISFFTQQFKLAIAMGQTRRQFFTAYVLTTLVQLAAVLLIIYFLHCGEAYVYRTCFPGYGYPIRIDKIFRMMYMVPAVVIIVVVQLFLQSIVLRFEGKGLYAIFLCWMGLILLSKRVHNLPFAHEIEATLAKIPNAGWILIGVAGVVFLVTIAWNIIRKQEIRGI
ncbi:MAG: hypothetical protein RR364_02615 [Lachnospiraceae bacterium]